MPISWTVGTSPNAELVNTMLDNAIALLNEDEHPIVHSDRGCHYRWPGWIQRMDNAGLIRSMSKKGCSPDVESILSYFCAGRGFFQKRPALPSAVHRLQFAPRGAGSAEDPLLRRHSDSHSSPSDV